MEENKLMITTKKLYKKNFDKKELWPNYVAFLEPAYKFSQAKVVLKKKQSSFIKFFKALTQGFFIFTE